MIDWVKGKKKQEELDIAPSWEARNGGHSDQLLSLVFGHKSAWKLVRIRFSSDIDHCLITHRSLRLKTLQVDIAFRSTPDTDLNRKVSTYNSERNAHARTNGLVRARVL